MSCYVASEMSHAGVVYQLSSSSPFRSAVAQIKSKASHTYMRLSVQWPHKLHSLPQFQKAESGSGGACSLAASIAMHTWHPCHSSTAKISDA